MLKAYLAMKQSAIIPMRLIAASVLHFPLAYFLFDSLYAGRGKHYYFPLGFTLFEFAVSASCIVILIPVLIRGDLVQRLIGVGLLVLPFTIFAVVARLVVELFSYAHA